MILFLEMAKNSSKKLFITEITEKNLTIIREDFTYWYFINVSSIHFFLTGSGQIPSTHLSDDVSNDGKNRPSYPVGPTASFSGSFLWKMSYA